VLAFVATPESIKDDMYPLYTAEFLTLGVLRYKLMVSHGAAGCLGMLFDKAVRLQLFS
jgi:hypothetical protein